MLMVSTTEGMFDWVHSNTTDLGPAVALDRVLMVSTASFQERLVNTSATSNDADGSTAA